MGFQFAKPINLLKIKPFVNCDVENCCNKSLIKGLCSKHYRQVQREGEVKSRTKRDLNEIEIHDDFALIHLYNIKSELIAKTIIDLEDVNKVAHLKWSVQLHFKYVYNYKVGRLHSLLMNTEEVVDHKNNDRLDNRKNNLRICTQAENNMNKIKPNNNTSGAKGVSWSKTKRVFLAYINKDGKRFQLGRFKDLILAAEAYNKAAKELFGEFAWYNDIEALKLQFAVTTTQGE